MGFLGEQLFGTRSLHVPATNLTGRVVVVTGANVGLGLETAIHLAKLNPSTLVVACRDEAKGAVAAARIAKEGGLEAAKVQVWKLDLASFASVKAFATRLESLPRLDIFVENAGVATMNYQKSEDNHELTVHVNDLSTGLLALLALPLLQKASLNGVPGSEDFKPHLTIVGSEVHAWAKFAEAKTAGSTLAALDDPAQFVGADRYNISKLINLFIAREIADLPAAKNVVVNVINPGLCVSELRREMTGILPWVLDSLARTAEQGARVIAWGALADTSATKGAYVSVCSVKPPSPFSTSPAGLKLQKKLWGEMMAVWTEQVPAVASIVA